ncbi:YeeE/YedE thiosulfate transporter family protein [Rhodoferax antarcticus]|uniref:Putative integral membrane protein, YeeE/YedE family n=1 Tax=Rhodoferax antarcticus ANT.BR TaxID=1111071 RepID=A0A1Q8YB77_9BURK|nr:YeeE/YedE thiosulfate transporter family protein [Rhodoferax antarcticus]APW46786.1 YeeE/YedE [Rhodoferax antarcticus]OLP05275.1 putative integral membrane protein, YeeE/YedE family [Rhodoferax antarcticus ANT.BR]
MKRLPLAALVAAFFIFLVMSVSVRQAVLLLVGVGMGAALAGARFGFTTGWRELIEQRDPRGVTGQIMLLALASLAALPLLGQFSELQAALGPPSVSLLVGAFLFGMTMQIADGCGSGTLYKAGLGVPLNMGILPLFALGSFLGSAHLDSWLTLGQIEPVSLSEQLGTGGALALTLTLLALALIAVRAWVGAGRQWLEKRWLWGAMALAVLATLNLLLAGQPWGVVYGFGLWAAKVSVALGAFDPTVNAFWSQSGNALRLTQTVLMDVTTITSIGILAGALWVSAKAPSVSQPLSSQQWAIGLVAGFVLGYSSRLAFGCNVGAMLSGISTGSLHGWIWVPLAFGGTMVGVRLRRCYGF